MSLAPRGLVLLVFAAAFWPSRLAAAEPARPAAVDLLGEGLARLGLTRADLGYRPQGSWTRFPLPATVPHLNPAFADLFARPQVIPRYLHGLADPVRKYLDPARVAEADDGLYQLTYHLAVERFAPGFRNYSANAVVAPPAPAAPLADALGRIRRELGGGERAFSFGGQYLAAADPDSAALAALDPELARIAAVLVLNLAEAARWSRLSFRRADRGLQAEALALSDLRESDAYQPAADDLALLWDRQSLAYGALKAAQALDTARLALAALPPAARRGEGILLDAATPIGRVVISGVDGGEHAAAGCLLWLDLGGDDRYTGAVAASHGWALPVSACLDLAGDDGYEAEDGAQGAGLLGCGLLVDVAGRDRYTATMRAQGYGQFGIGLAADLAGDDDWRLEAGGQGAGYFGCGLLLDAAGNDAYYLHGEGQGFGGVGGVGVLAAWGGDDGYTAEPDARVAGRADYHSEHRIAANAAQGAGMGRRGDGSDGHSWAGGLGALIDIRGRDSYRSGNWSLGCGYWFGIGLLYEGAGDDRYESVYFTQASGAHYCVGAILDEAGDDEHILGENAGAGLAFGWDYTNALLVDAAGNDRYEAKIISLGLGMIRSNALFIDLAGDDLYRLDAGQLGLGAADLREEYKRPPATAPSYGESLTIGLLLDGGGRDRYERRAADGSFAPDSSLSDGVWRLAPAPGSPEAGFGNLGALWDGEGGALPELGPFLAED
ncbi:hypothetical protein FJ251_10500 [bacterium]|nr:hypothetical protein [bacterium]